MTALLHGSAGGHAMAQGPAGTLLTQGMPPPRSSVRDTAIWEDSLMYVSMALLLISTVQEAGLITDAIKLMWLASFALLTLLNGGAAFAVYVSAVLLYRGFHFDRWGSLLERPDNFALIVLVAALGVRLMMARHPRLWEWSTLVIGAFLGYGLLHTAWMGLLSRSAFAYFMSMLGLPMVMFLLLKHSHLAQREFRSLVRALLVLGAYMALVSIAETLGLYHWVLPPWIGEQAAVVHELYPGQAGGLEMQPAWNGLALSLVFCLAVLGADILNHRFRWLVSLVGALCLVGVFLTFNRAAWLACGLASFVLLWRRSSGWVAGRFRRYAAIGAATAIVAALAFIQPATTRTRVGDTGTMIYRLNLWKAAIAMVADRPLFGSGFGTFNTRVEDYQDAMTVGPRVRIRGAAAHNTELSILVELGALGLLLYSAALVMVLVGAARGATLVWARDGTLWAAVFFGVYVLQAQFAVAHEPATNQILFGTMGAVAGLALGAPRFVLPRLARAQARGGST